MSTALEAIAARHLGAEVLAISLVTNLAAGLDHTGLNHAEVVEAGRNAAARLGGLLGQILPRVLPASEAAASEAAASEAASSDPAQPGHPPTGLSGAASDGHELRAG